MQAQPCHRARLVEQDQNQGAVQMSRSPFFSPRAKETAAVCCDLVQLRANVPVDVHDDEHSHADKRGD